MPKQTETLARFSPTQLERFLVEMANLQVRLEAIRRFRERFTGFIPPHDPRWLDNLAAKKEEAANELSKLPSDVSLKEIEESVWVCTLKLILRNLWTEPDLRQKEWGVFA